MKRLADRGSLRPPRRGYVAKCARCGLEVVHSKATALPFPQHLNSKACAGSAPSMAMQATVLAALPRRVELPELAAALHAARAYVELRLDGTYGVHVQRHGRVEPIELSCTVDA